MVPGLSRVCDIFALLIPCLGTGDRGWYTLRECWRIGHWLRGEGREIVLRARLRGDARSISIYTVVLNI